MIDNTGTIVNGIPPDFMKLGGSGSCSLCAGKYSREPMVRVGESVGRGSIIEWKRWLSDILVSKAGRIVGLWCFGICTYHGPHEERSGNSFTILVQCKSGVRNQYILRLNIWNGALRFVHEREIVVDLVVIVSAWLVHG